MCTVGNVKYINKEKIFPTLTFLMTNVLKDWTVTHFGMHCKSKY